ncbi:MAG: glycosyltransferase family 39 protein [Acidobacteria bacterium]|nr:glycosyltransferase family 39 protein [Acidobacteriota bacterium]
MRPVGGLDTEYYVTLARQVAGGDVLLGPQPYFVSPLYIYFTAAILAMAGPDSLLVVRIAQIALGTAAVWLVWDMARQWFGRRAAWIASTLAAVTGLFTFYEILLLQAAIDPFLTALHLNLLTRAVRSDRVSVFALTGLAIGMHALNRPNILPYGMVLVAAVVARSWWDTQAIGTAPAGAASTDRLLATRRATMQASALALGLTLGIVPVTSRNYAVSGEAILITSHGGLNFYIGNNPEADGTYHGVPGITPAIAGQARDARRVAERSLGRALTAREVSDYFYARAWTWIRENPARAARLLAKKVALVCNAAFLPLNFSYAYYSRDAGTLLAALMVGPWLLIPLGTIGLMTARPAGAGYWTWAAFVPIYGLSVAAFFVAARYRTPILVPLCAAAGALIDRVFTAIRQHDVGRLTKPLVAAAALFVFVNWNWGLDDGRAEERTAMAVRLIEDGRSDEARGAIALAAEHHPAPSLLRYRVGRAYQDRGAPDEAILQFDRALALEDRAEIRFSLGEALLDSGRAADAVPHLRAAYARGVSAEVAGFDLARALMMTRKAGEAARVLERLSIAADADPRRFLAAGDLALQLNRPELAVRFLRGSVRRDPRSPAAREKLGLALGLAGDRTGGISELEHATRLDPTSATAHLNLAVLYAQEGRFAEARAEATRALAIAPNYVRARDFLRTLERSAKK